VTAGTESLSLAHARPPFSSSPLVRESEGIVVLERASDREDRRRAREAREPSLEEGLLCRALRRAANEQTAAAHAEDPERLVELVCECRDAGCERTVRVPLYAYCRILEAGDHYLLQTGHHASPRYRTIVAFGLIAIEEDEEEI
jgi:hypothetical protein